MAILPSIDLVQDAELCIVGAGPVGLALALACARHGLQVLVVEAGDLKGGGPADATRAEIGDAATHARIDVAMARGLGGTSSWWGGRCVPFDDIDFEAREATATARWPIDHGAIKPWYEPAASFLGCAPARFSLPEHGWPESGDLRSDTLERWTPQPNVGLKYRSDVEGQPSLQLLPNHAATGLAIEGDRVAGVKISTPDGAIRTVTAARYVVAGGGLETTRLLLSSRLAQPGLFGGADGPLGRFYAGHISGKIADIQLADPRDASAHDYFLDGACYARRRLTLAADLQRSEGLLNAAFWLDNPPFENPDHRSALLSAVWMALAFRPVGARILPEAVRLSHVGAGRGTLPKHLRNVATGFAGAGADLARIARDRFLRSPRKPGFLLRNREGRYALHYHAEQSPSPSSRVELSSETDSTGERRLRVGFRYQAADVRSVIRSHELLDRALKAAGKGRLLYRAAPDELEASVWRQAADGFHQTGMTRMGVDRRDSVVNADCRTHDLDNLYIASSSVLATSGQANPTLLAVALALRLADHLCASRAAPVAA